MINRFLLQGTTVGPARQQNRGRGAPEEPARGLT
jgi:hypothetical protein